MCACLTCTAQHDCASGLCLDDVCSQSCEDGGDCADPLAVCQPILGLCVAGTCTPDCTGLTCGDDGCGGTCGPCAGGEVCSAGQCVSGGQNDIACPYLPAGGCATGEACCVSQGNQSACFALGSVKESACKAAADSYEYLYIGCSEDADCPGQVCCADTHKSYCADSCQTPVCQRGVPSSCAAGSACCPFLSTSLFFTTDPRDEGYCFPGACP